MSRNRDEYERRVNAVMDHVRRHLDRPLSLDELARVACFSPYHFHRLFTSIAGETLGSFTRRARLERAAYLMKASPRRPLGAIALDAGFSSQSDFSRVFRATYGVAPSAWDRVSVLRPQATSDDGPPDSQAGPGRYGRPDPPIETTVRHHPACRVAYVRLRNPWGAPEAIPAAYDALRSWLEARGVRWRERALLAMSWDHYDATPLEKVTFDLGFSVPAGIDAADEVGIHELPPVAAVDAHSDGPMLRIAQAWDHLYLEWLPDSPYEPASLPAIKRFRRRPDETGWEHWDVDCSIAIVRRGQHAFEQDP